MKKIRVLFPFVEAGFGHIMPMRSISETFKRKYGDKVEVVTPFFFEETGDRHLIGYERMMSRQVRLYNRFPAVGYVITVANEILGAAVSSFLTIRLVAPIAWRRGVAHMKELSPDVVFSTHWATNYYARHMKDKPLTVMYCPDAQFNQMFSYPSDLYMISMPRGYEKALKRKRFTKENTKLVPFLIRNEAFSIDPDKKRARRALGLPEDNFTVLLTEGAYGIGKMKKISRLLIKERLPLTVIAVCGKNEKLYRQLTALVPSPEVTFRPCEFAENILEYQAAADLFCGKSGNILAEAAFFGNPTIVTNSTSLIEKKIADHYVDVVGCAMREFSPEKTVAYIRRCAADPSVPDAMRRAALAWHDRFGSEEAADLLYAKIKERFPFLEEEERGFSAPRKE